ncbi:SDR family oxidoreductase, partial [bacterium]|nr:SDR family oxidoreductase [bacterium]
MYKLENRQILVTGGTSGIGLATVKQLADLGAHVILLGRSSERMQAVIDLLPRPEVHGFVEADLSKDAATIPKLVKSISEDRGPIHGMFHCAGIARLKPIAIVGESDIDHEMTLSFKSGLMLAKGLSQKGVRDPDIRASILFMSSVASVAGQKGMSVYSGARSALDGAMRSLACELAPQIRVNSILSGAVETPMHEKLVGVLPQASIDAYRQQHLLGFGSPEDVANMAVFLLSDLSKWVTGASF